MVLIIFIVIMAKDVFQESRRWHDCQGTSQSQAEDNKGKEEYSNP
jgi:hypothetical protein